MAIEITYPCRASREPVRLSAKAIRALAANGRRLFSGHTPRPLEIDRLARRTERIRINGLPLRIEWDWGHPVHDPEGNPAWGVCEHDPAVPDTIMISLNGEVLGDRPELLRSTAAHELAHAIFDMPAAIGARHRCAFRSKAEPPPSDTPFDWAEWRADEFMGEFLAPRALLAKALPREASAHGVPLHWRESGGQPMPRIANADFAALDSIVGALAERFGVSYAFMEVRLARNGFVAGGAGRGT